MDSLIVGNRNHATKKTAKSKDGNGVKLGIENELWEANKLRGHLDAAEYKSMVLGLIFLKYISDLFEQVRTRVEREGVDDPEDKDVCLQNISIYCALKIDSGNG